MAGNFNRVILMGNITRDIELRQAGSTSVANVGLAVSRRYTTNDGPQQETTFVDCTAWGKTADIMAQHLGKGDPVMIEGRLTLDQWEQDGQKRSKLKVTIDTFQFVRDKGEGGSNEPAPPKQKKQQAGNNEEWDDDIPF